VPTSRRIAIKSKAHKAGSSAADRELLRFPTIAEMVLESIGALQNPLFDLSKTEGWADDIARFLHDCGVFDGLSAEQQRTVAKLITELNEVENAVPSVTQPIVRERKKWASHSATRTKRIASKTENARRAILALRRRLLGFSIDITAIEPMFTAALATLDPTPLQNLQDRIPPLLETLARASRQGVDDALLALYDRFVACGIPAGDAEYRAAFIANQFWETRFSLTEHNSDGEKARGCDAIRKRVRRRRLAGDKQNSSR
jgi:hypothetical protein